MFKNIFTWAMLLPVMQNNFEICPRYVEIYTIYYQILGLYDEPCGY